ncbi:interleukin 17a/f1 [Megalobrama amblycephala]|uniref:interleukin 17a/f1 n=1 Tax=Megalobrama amblycephala TaxID=75352 RepID=UPI00201423AA|nr:interleukin 17a/f1 [Megalobrama amblycephala]
MNATMSSALNIQFLVVACMMGLVLISFGAEGAPSKHLQKKGSGQHRSSDESDPSSSYRLILDSEFKAAKPIRSLNNDSISPWTYTFTHDENLYPSSIAEAKCSLTGCLIDESEDYLSQPIYTQIMVLRRIRGEKHNYSFRIEYKTIAVGCTCIRPYVEHV